MKSMYLQHPSRKLFFLIHGYTGSPTDFNGLPEYLYRKHKADVGITLLKGHGTDIKDLDSLEFNDFLEQAENELRKNLKKYDEVILGGVSFGAQLALILASRYPVRGVFDVCLPYRLKFPFNACPVALLGSFKKYWPKLISEEEQILRRNAFYYKDMHIKGLKIVKQANRELYKALPHIKCQILTIHSNNDPISNYKAIKSMEKNINVPHVKEIFHNKNHNIFFTNRRFDLYEKIGTFFESSQAKNNIKKHKIAAIVPAYNEGTTISEVLKVLSRTDVINEIIVIDDGSTDNTSQEVSALKHITLLRNNENKGKAYSIQRGISATDAGILFFCDADLRGLTPGIVEQIIRPVIDQRYDMYIGIRNNVMQKALTLFALNSGERALRRELWDELPENFKHRYRIEAGLNCIARSHGKNYGWQRFNYYQTLKEKKYGFSKGVALRWWMSLDVGHAYLLTIAYRMRDAN